MPFPPKREKTQEMRLFAQSEGKEKKKNELPTM